MGIGFRKGEVMTTPVKQGDKKRRTPGHRANYQDATPKQVARALYWNRRKKPACHQDRVAEDDPVFKASI